MTSEEFMLSVVATMTRAGDDRLSGDHIPRLGKSVELGNEDVFYRIALERIDRCTFGAALKRAKRELERAA